eukprot:COSAG02_NODE_2751_length_8098_cov_4.799600_2_plen_60_part_00
MTNPVESTLGRTHPAKNMRNMCSRFHEILRVRMRKHQSLIDIVLFIVRVSMGAGKGMCY